MDARLAQSVDSVFRMLDRELWVVTSADGPRRGGLVATWVSQASLDDQAPVVVAGLAPNHFTAELVLASKSFAVHLLAERHMPLVWRFAIGSGRDRDKFESLDTTTAVTGAPIVADSLAWFDCRVITHVDAGDRLFFWADVVACAVHGNDPPIGERDLVRAASREQMAQLRADRSADIERQRPLAAAWRACLKAR